MIKASGSHTLSTGYAGCSGIDFDERCATGILNTIIHFIFFMIAPAKNRKKNLRFSEFGQIIAKNRETKTDAGKI